MIFKYKNEKGSVLAYILIMVSLVMVILTGAIQFIVSQIKYSTYNNAREEAFQIAESGVNYFRWYLAHNTDGRTAQQVAEFWETREIIEAEDTGQDYLDPNGGMLGKFKLEVTPPQNGSTIAVVKSTGWSYKYPDQTRIIQVRLRRPSWSEFIVLADDDMRFGEGTEIYGKVKSNFGIRFDGLAHNIVSSAVYKYDDPDHGGGKEYGVHTHVSPIDPLPNNPLPDRSDVFEAGRRIEVLETSFTGIQADLNLMKSVADAGINGSLYFDDSGHGRHIILNSNGTFSIRTVKTFNGNSNEINKYLGSWNSYPIPDNGIIFVQNNVWIEGELNNKRVTVVAANIKIGTKYSIFLKNDLFYSQYDGSAILGLVAQEDIEVIENSESDLRIDAAMIAQEGRIGRQHYCTNWLWMFCVGYNDIKDTITVFGSIATNGRYGFAYTDGSGYQTRNLIYDNNLLYYPPPYFPTGNEYLMDLWEEIKN